MKEHLRKHRPKEYRELKAAGTLDRVIEKRSIQASELMSTMIKQGASYSQALEHVREIQFPESEQEEAAEEREIKMQERQTAY